MSVERPDCEVRVLGSVALVVDGKAASLTGSERQVLAILAAAGPLGLSQDSLADALWGERLPKTWASSLRTRISLINKKAGSAVIQTGGGVRLLNLPSESVDFWAFTSAIDGDDVDSGDVDSDNVDGDNVDSNNADGDSLDPNHLVGSPFAGSEISSLIRGAIGEIEAARRDLVSRWEASGQTLSKRMLAALRTLVEYEPYDDELAMSVVRLHLRSGDRLGAMQTIEVVRSAMSDLGTDATASMKHLDQLLIDYDARKPTDTGPIQPSGLRSAFSEADVGGSSPTKNPTLRSPALVALAAAPMVGRSGLVSDLKTHLGKPGSSGVILQGQQGIGKTRIAAELAQEFAVQGFHTAYIAASERFGSSLQPYVEGLPELGATFEEFLSERLDDPNDRARCWIAVLNQLRQRGGERPLLLVIDDAQWLDPLSVALTVFLSRVDQGPDIKLVVVGHDIVTRDTSPSWPELAGELTKAGLRSIRVDPLTERDIEDLLEGHAAQLSSIRLAAIARSVQELSGGLPAVADWLVNRLDSNSFEPPSASLGETGYSVVVAALPQDVQQLGATGAVFGSTFTLDKLANLVPDDPINILELTEQLLESNLVDEAARPGEFRFSHVLVADAFRQRISAARRTGLHFEALGECEDVHERAWHAWQSVPVTAPADAASALVASAEAHFATGNYPQAAAALGQAAQMDPRQVKLAHRALLAEALERGGRPAAETRRRAITDYLLDEQPQEALNVAIAGLPEVERLDGDPNRIADIMLVDDDLLDHEGQARKSVHLSRQFLLAGRTEEAEATAEAAFRQSATASEKAEAWLALRHAEGWSPESRFGAEPNWSESITSPRLIARLHEANIIAMFSAGLTHSSLARIAEHVEHARTTTDTLALWHALLLQATASTDFGHIDQAREAADEAQRIGLRFGLAGSALAAQAQGFQWARLEGTLLESRGIEQQNNSIPGPTDAQTNPLFQAGMSHVLLTLGQLDDVGTAARQLVELAWTSRFAIAALSLGAEVIAASGDEELIGTVHKRLATKSGQNIIVGAALANLGPCSAVIAQLYDDAERKLPLLLRAIGEADSADAPLWQITTRLQTAATVAETDQAEASNLRREADALATTPWLALVSANGQHR